MKKSRVLSLVLAAALTISSVASVPATSDAAKKPKLNKKKLTMIKGKTYKLKVKNGNKKAKVTWKTSKKSVVKIAKKNGKGKTAYASIKALKKGKATITASYKLGKKKAIKLKCNVTVKLATPAAPTPVVTDPVAPVATTPAAPAVTTPAATDVATKPTKTPKPPKTPKPSPTIKPSAAPVDGIDVTQDCLDILQYSVLDLAEGITATTNDDGSVTLDFTGTSYKGARWYFGKETDEVDPETGKKKVVQTPLDLSNYTYVVVEGDNQAGLSLDDEGKCHDLSTQFLDASDVADHGGLLEINTQANFGFPCKFDLDGTRVNVAAYEIYSLGDAASTKAGPITVRSVKAYKDKATYDKMMADAGATPEPTKAPEPTPDASNSYTVDLTDESVVTVDSYFTPVFKDGAVTITAPDTSQGHDVVIKLSENEINKKYTKVKIDYEVESGTFNYKYLAQDASKRPSDWGGYDWAYGDSKYDLAKGQTTKTVTFRTDAVPVSELAIFNVNSAGKMTIKSICFFEPKDAPQPTDDPQVTEAPQPTDDPQVTDAPQPTDDPQVTDAPQPTDDPQVTEAPVNPGYEVNLAGTKNYNTDGSVAYENGVLTATGVKGILIPIVGTFAKDDKVSVTVEGESSGAVRSWLVKESGNNDQLSTAVVNPITLGQAYELTFGEDFENPYLHIKVPAWDSPALDNLTITNVVITKIVPATPSPAPTAEPTATPEPTEVPISIEPTQTTVPVDESIYVRLAADNVAFTDFQNSEVYEDGKAHVELGYIYGGYGVCYYINDDKGAVNLSDYDSVVFDITSEGEYPITIETLTNIVEGDYWANANAGDKKANTTYRSLVVGANQITLDFNGDAQGVFVKFNPPQGCDYKARITINSIKLVKTGAAEVDVFTVPDEAETITVTGLPGIDASTDEKIALEDLDGFVDDYADMHETLSNMMDKTGGEVSKFVGNKEVVYTPSEAGKGDITVGDKEGTIEITEDGNVITADVTLGEDSYVVSVDSANSGKVNITKGDEEGYSIDVAESSDGYVVSYVTADGKTVTFKKNASGYSIVSSGDVTVGYNKKAPVVTAVDLSDSSTWRKENGDPSVVFEGGVLDCTFGGFQGLIVNAPNDGNTYTTVKMTYDMPDKQDVNEDVNFYLNAKGSEEGKLVVGTDSVAEYSLAEGITSIKLFNFGGTVDVAIKSIEFIAE
ncbi:MAG: hypothetical protein E7265_03590 [Lachnospiraceae bacterium]|nr:hypothetical protein [Lachnospiraceae bacterium]